jgi:hypothetical protein
MLSNYATLAIKKKIKSQQNGLKKILKILMQ